MNSTTHALPVLWILFGLVLAPAFPVAHAGSVDPDGAVPFLRSDSNSDGMTDLADAINTFNFLFTGRGNVTCRDAADANNDGRFELSDGVHTLSFLFRGGPPPDPPFPECGVEPTTGALRCETSLHSCADDAPNLRHVLGDCGGLPSESHPNSLKPGTDLHKVTLDVSGAVCNDGSPPVYYIKAAPDGSDDADKWGVHLQGGGSCSSYEECRDRWCSNGTSYDAAKMSSRFCPPTIRGTGIFHPMPANYFANWNHVFVYYCSSDGWKGQNDHAVLVDPDGVEESFSLHFQGHRILEALVSHLLEGQVTSDDGEFVLPPLEDASQVIFSGSSAGSGGVRHNADWFASHFDPKETEVSLVLDAGVNFLPELHNDPGVAADLVPQNEELLMNVWEHAVVGVWNAFIDESCVSYNEATGEEWRCASNAHLSYHHLTTPYFVRMDLRDPVADRQRDAFGIDMTTFAALNRATLLSLAEAPQQGIESSAIQRTPGVFGPNCGVHIVLRANLGFFESTVEDSDGTPWTFHDALVAWLGGTDVEVVDRVRDGTSVCR